MAGKVRYRAELDPEHVEGAQKNPSTPHKLRSQFRTLGIILSEDGKVPESAGVPRIFMIKDGKALSLEEGGATLNSPAFLEALLKGQIFAYPTGEKRPVQMRGRYENELIVTHGEVLDAADPRKGMRLAEPIPKPKPRWYHKLFSFIPSNRRLIDEYAQYERERAAKDAETAALQQEYEKDQDEIDAVNAAAEKFGARRDEKSLEADKEMKEQIDREEAAREADSMEREKVRAVEDGIDIMVSVYRAHPEFREEFEKKNGAMDDKGYYTREHFDTLTTANIDPEKVEIGGKSVTEREFATLAMFAATNVDTSLEQQKLSVGDPSGTIETFQRAGYSEAQAERLVADANNSTFTVDILHKENRMYKYFPAVNSGRDLAAKALAVYPADKKPLAEILSRAVEYGGMRAGTDRDKGVTAMAKLGSEMLALMERDPELKELAKQSFEQREEEFCESTRIPEKKFDDLVKNIRDKMKFEEVRQKGFESRVALLRARAEGKELSPEEKKGYVHDILAGNMVEELRQDQVKQAEKEPASEKGQPFNLNSMMDEFMRLTTLDTSGGRGVGATGSGSSLASNAPTIFNSAITQRVTKTPDALSMVTKPAEMEKMRNTIDKIIDADQLGDKSLDELIRTVASTSSDTYDKQKLMDKAVKAEKLAPEAQQNAPEKQLETEKKVNAAEAAAPKA